MFSVDEATCVVLLTVLAGVVCGEVGVAVVSGGFGGTQFSSLVLKTCLS